VILVSTVKKLAPNTNTTRGKFKVPPFLPEGKTANSQFSRLPINIVAIRDRYIVV
jgi:hypothetical protein